MPEYRKKLIEIALPLEAIDKESIREKEPFTRKHPRSLHIWWSRKPLVTCRAVLFAQMVDDPSSLPDEFPTREAQEAERQRLFHIIEEIVKWENTTNEVVLHRARVEIARSAARNHGISLPPNLTPVEVADALKHYAPPVSDVFAGGGSIPLEAQRLGLEAHASDLNPVAVLINKALVEIPPKFADRQPVNPEAKKTLMERDWLGAQGLADDIRYYGKLIRDEADRHIGHLYPKVTLSKEYGGGEATVIAWLWMRTVTCPNPACGAQMPLTSTWWLSKKKGRKAWIEPIANQENKTIHFEIRTGEPDLNSIKEIDLGTGFTGEQGKKTKATFRCITCKIGTVGGEYIDREADKGQMGVMPLAIVAEGKRSRVYLPFDSTHAQVARNEAYQYLSQALIEGKLPKEGARGTFASNAQGRIYGFKTFADYFTPRQLVALTTFSDLVQEAREKVLVDAIVAGLPIDGVSLKDGGTGANAYADAIATYLGLATSRWADLSNSICSWNITNQNIRALFARQAITMVWGFAEVNPFGPLGTIEGIIGSYVSVIEALPAYPQGYCCMQDAATLNVPLGSSVISIDPPYYANVGYADLSDFFYVWLRRSLNSIYPELFSTLLVPKAQELVVMPHRFGGSPERAKQFFEVGLGKAFAHLREAGNSAYPQTVYYALKQAESDEDDSVDGNGTQASVSTGWETMLEGLLRAGFMVAGTWPMRTERNSRSGGIGTNALASSIVLVCRPRATDAPLTTRRDFLNALKRELPKALRNLQHGNIAPVDLAQASIGPGMAIFSRYSNVLESDGTPMRVRTALQLINQALDEVLAEQEGEYDGDTRWAIAWFEQYGMDEGPYGIAETLSKAKNSAVGALVEAGILRAQGGKVRLLRRDEFSSDWNPATAKRLTVWEVTQRLILALQEMGEAGAAAILDHVGTYGEVAHDLAYRLYTVCERKKWADEAMAYNSLVVEWSDINGAAEQLRRTTAEQARLFS